MLPVNVVGTYGIIIINHSSVYCHCKRHYFLYPDYSFKLLSRCFIVSIISFLSCGFNKIISHKYPAAFLRLIRRVCFLSVCTEMSTQWHRNSQNIAAKTAKHYEKQTHIFTCNYLVNIQVNTAYQPNTGMTCNTKRKV